MKKPIVILLFTLFLISCDNEVEQVNNPSPKTKESVVVIDTPRSKEKGKIRVSENEILINKIYSLPRVMSMNKDLTSRKMKPLQHKLFDKSTDSVLSIKLGKFLDTNFVTEIEFYINKKTKDITVYDQGEDLIVPLEKWQEGY